MQHTRACFDEQNTAYWILFDVLVAGGDAEDVALLPDDTVEGFPSGDWENPSLDRFGFVSLLNNKDYCLSNRILTFRIPFFTRWWNDNSFMIKKGDM
jgi:hypothetical protein